MTEFPRKPAFGDPCNGCGLCCVATACGLAVEFVAGAEFGQPCPALEWEGGRSWCGLVRHPARHAPLVALAVASGFTTEAEVGEKAAHDLTGGDGWGGCDAGPPPGPDEVDDDVGLTAGDYANLMGLGLR